MRQLLKFLHTMGAIGLMGAMVCLLVLLITAPPTTSLKEYVTTRLAMSAIATWIFLPSLGVTLVAGLLAIAANRVYQNAGWAWVKLASGILLFEGGFTGIVGPMQDEAEKSSNVLSGHDQLEAVGQSIVAEQNTLWLLLAVATANVALGIWRLRLTRLPD